MSVKIWVGSSGDTSPGTSTNWSPAGIPASGDSVIIPASAAYNMDGYDLTSSGTIAFVGVTVEPGCTIDVGSSSTYVKLLMKHNGTYYDVNTWGTGNLYLNVDNWGNINVQDAGPAPATGQWATNLIGTHDAVVATGGTINILSGNNTTVGIGANANEDMEFNKLVISGTPGDVNVGPNCTAYDNAAAIPVDQSGGTLTMECAATTVTKRGGDLWFEGSGAMTTLNENGGNTYYMSTGTLTTANVTRGGTLDFSKDLRARTVTNMNVYEGGSLKDPFKSVTFTNGVDLVQRGNGNDIDLGTNLTLTRSAI